MSDRPPLEYDAGEPAVWLDDEPWPADWPDDWGPPDDEAPPPGKIEDQRQGEMFDGRL
jgi:hypothetical protein